MKILAIRGKNLASIEGEFEIDFTSEPLHTAGIFAITGMTGAGKSTILDAMCLALFAQFPRLLSAQERNIEVRDGEKSTISQGDPRTILRKGTVDGYAETDFTGVDGNSYRARWSVRRGRYKLGENLQNDHVVLSALPSGEVLGERKKETLERIKELVGLNFEQFRRSVLLAQNDFTAFLKADKNEKANLLEKLTGTDIYSTISIAVFNKWKASNDDLYFSKRRLEGVELLNEEKLAELKSLAESSGNELKSSEEKLSFLDKDIKWYQDLDLLVSNKENADKKYQQILLDLQNLRDFQQILSQIEEIQPVRSIFETRKLHQKSVNEKDTLLNEVQQSLNALIVNLEKQQNEDITIKHQSDILLSEQNRMRPLLEQAKKLDVVLNERNKQLESYRKEYELSKEKTTICLTKKENNLLDIKKTADAIDALQHWFQQNSEKEKIAGQIASIRIRLTEGAKIILKLEEIEKTSRQILGRKKEFEASLKKIASDKEEKTDEFIILQNELQQIEQQKTGINLNELLLEKSKKSVLLQNISDYELTVNEYLKSRSLLNEKEANLKKEKELLEKDTAALSTISHELTAAKERLSQSEKLLEKAKLAVYKDVVEIRKQLETEQPCPVCGSTSHPYASSDQKLDTLFNELQQETDACRNRVDELQTASIHTAQIIKNRKENLEQLTLEIAALSVKSAEWNDKKENTSIHKKYESVEESNLANQLIADKKSIAANLNDIEKKEKEYYSLNQQQDTFRKQSDDFRDELNHIENQLIDIKKKVDKEKQQHEILLAEKENLQLSLNEAIDAVNDYFPDEKWIGNWKTQPDSFLQKAVDFAGLWQKKQEQLIQEKQHSKTFLALSANLTEQYEQLKKEEDSLFSKLEEEEKKCEAYLSERKNLFEGRPVSEIESENQQNLQEIQEKIKTSQEKFSKMQAEIQTLKGKKENVESDLSDLHAQIEKSEQDVMHFINSYNNKKNHENVFTWEIVENLFAYSSDWINEKRALIQQANDAFIQAKTSCEERELQLEKHKEAKHTDQDLNMLVNQKDELLKQIGGEKSKKQEYEYQLRQHKENEKKYDAIIKEIETKQQRHKRWEDLNALIGSADGKKFRQFAQEYTLDVLLSYANVHLQDLTPRYRIDRIFGTLALQVIDQDLGDEVRSVHSLSGGESFLVSLALALGLASLSSNRMNIESLFIDEGFGALDTETLRIAMDALEHLHAKGRKIGVISHIQEMMERIPVQIKVEKITAGKSKISIS